MAAVRLTSWQRWPSSDLVARLPSGAWRRVGRAGLAEDAVPDQAAVEVLLVGPSFAYLAHGGLDIHKIGLKSHQL